MSAPHCPSAVAPIQPVGFFARWIWRPIRLFLIAYFLVMLLAMFFEEWFVFHPQKFPEGDWNPGGLKVEDAWFQAEDGTRLHGWYVPHAQSRATILFCHGNAGNVSHRSDVLRWLHREVGASVLAFDYRGFGRSEGHPSEQGVLADARAARAWLAQREQIAQRDIVMMGESLGGGVAVDLAARDGARALVLESTFSSLPDVATNLLPIFPFGWLMRTRLDSLSKIGDYQGPLFQSHSAADDLVPYSSGRRLFDAANEPKEFFAIKNGGHNDPRTGQYYETLRAFLEKHGKRRL